MDLGITSSPQYPEQALPIEGELQPMDRRLPRMQSEWVAGRKDKGSTAHAWGKAGTGTLSRNRDVENPSREAEVGCSQSSHEPAGLYFCMSHCRRRTMEGSLFAASLNSSREIWSSLSLSIFVKILSTRCCGVSPSWFILIMITVPTIL